MTSPTISLLDQLSPALRRAAEGLDDLSVPMGEIAVDWLEATRTRFLAETSPAGVPWQKSRRAIEDGDNTLFESGALFNQLDNDFGPNFAEIGVQATGGPAIYARILNDGGTIRPRTRKALKMPFGVFAQVVIPKREYIGAAGSDQVNAVTILSEHLQSLFNAGEGGTA